MTDSSLTQVRILKESTWGTTPASALANLRVTGESLGRKHNTTLSNEINATRQNTDVTRTLVEADGGLDGEIIYDAALQTLMEGAAMDAWTAAVTTAATDIDAVASDDSYNRSSGSFVTDGITAGQWILVAGFTTAGNNGWKKVLTVAALKITVAQALTDEAAGDSVTMKGSKLVNGTTKVSFTIEKEFVEVTQFWAFTGMRCGTFSMNIQPGSIMTWQASFMGKQGVRSGATVGTGAATAASTTSVMSAVANVSMIQEGGASLTADLTQISFNINNALRPRPAIANLTNVGIGIGTVEVTGNLTCYLANGDLYDKFVGHTASSLSFLLTDEAGNQIMVTFPRLRYTSAEVVAGGKDQDVVVNMGFTAYKDPVTGITFQFDRVPA